jgi:hypothetical protein
MNRTGHRYRKRRSCAALLHAAAFVFFLLYTAPHRVHHFFEQSPGIPPVDHARPNDTSGNHGHEGNPQHPLRTDCAAQTAAQNSHCAAPPLIELPFSILACAHFEATESARDVSFNPAPCSQRAPPLA